MNPDSIESEEISLLDIVDFLQSTWKKLAIAAALGAAIGMASWFAMGNYEAQYVLLNNTNNTNNTNTYALDIVSWKTLQKSLPNLAAQVLDDGKVPQGQENLYRSLENDQWWQKNVIPSYAISKADTKDLAGISKDLDAASTTILNLTVSAQGKSKASAIDNVRAASLFIRTGGAYLQLQNLLNGYEGETISTVADIQKKITTTQIEMGYQVERAKQLEELHKRFPAGANVTGQVVDPKDSGAKYLPLQTQIVAVNNDINASKENLKRLSDRLKQLAIIKQFVQAANPLLAKTPDGLALANQLLDLEDQLRKGLSKDDANAQEILDNLHAQLLQISTRFTKGLEANTAPVAKKQGLIKATAGGLFAAFFLMLLVLLGQRVWQTVKSGVAK